MLSSTRRFLILKPVSGRALPPGVAVVRKGAFSAGGDTPSCTFLLTSKHTDLTSHFDKRRRFSGSLKLNGRVTVHTSVLFSSAGRKALIN